MCPIFQFSLLSSLAFGAAGMLMAVMGAGGSLLALPAFLVILKVPMPQAIAASSAVVGMAAFSTFLDEKNRASLPKVPAVWFLLPLLLGSLAGALVLPWIETRFLAFALAALLAWAGWNALRTDSQEVGVLRALPLSGAGAGVGLIMGVLGVGGGFLAVPSLQRWGGIEHERAISLSLLGIGLGAALSLFLHWQEGAFRIGLVLPALMAVLIGMEIGTHLRRRLPPVFQSRVFGGVLWVVALGVLVKTLG
jgi:uncharacterized protein